jgi:hypothetical protein
MRDDVVMRLKLIAMMGAEIPDDAESLHDGTPFRMARVPAPPASMEEVK